MHEPPHLKTKPTVFVLEPPDEYKAPHDETSLTPATPEIRAYETLKLALLVQTLNGTSAMIGGGMAVELLNKDEGITRLHADAEVIIFEDEFDAVADHLESLGWRVFQKDPESAEAEGAHEFEARNWIHTQAGYIQTTHDKEPQPSIHLGMFGMQREVNNQGETTRINTNGTDLPLEWFLEPDHKTLKHATSISGATAHPLPPELLVALKARTNRPKDIADGRILYQFIDPNEYPRVAAVAHEFLHGAISETFGAIYDRAFEASSSLDEIHATVETEILNHPQLRSALKQQTPEFIQQLFEATAQSPASRDTFIAKAFRLLQPLLHQHEQNIDDYLAKIQS